MHILEIAKRGKYGLKNIKILIRAGSRWQARAQGRQGGQGRTGRARPGRAVPARTRRPAAAGLRLETHQGERRPRGHTHAAAQRTREGAMVCL